MDDEVKITVIATGFERDNLPQIARPSARREPEQAAPPPPPPAPEPQPMLAAEPDPEPVITEEPLLPLDDLDVPAYLTRDRRYYQ